jgi:hypothetical protein
MTAWRSKGEALWAQFGQGVDKAVLDGMVALR